METLRGIEPRIQRKLLQDNAVRLYRIDLPSA
jgi:hypothetical protein